MPHPTNAQVDAILIPTVRAYVDDTIKRVGYEAAMPILARVREVWHDLGKTKLVETYDREIARVKEAR